ncbi:protein raptor homolog isoform X2 [Oscarella lobularis]|uniref:protein raptor homolog isoform X2 n=1 Tax=Oscarella lobularis TaxID=121494 RepID=UPI003313A53F
MAVKVLPTVVQQKCTAVNERPSLQSTFYYSVTSKVGSEGGSVRLVEACHGKDSDMYPRVEVPASTVKSQSTMEVKLEMSPNPPQWRQIRFASPMKKETETVIGPYVSVALETDDKVVRPVFVTVPHEDVDAITAGTLPVEKKPKVEIREQVADLQGRLSDWKRVEEAKIGKSESRVPVSDEGVHCFVPMAKSTDPVKTWCTKQLEFWIFGDPSLSRTMTLSVICLANNYPVKQFKQSMSDDEVTVAPWSRHPSKMSLPLNDVIKFTMNIDSDWWQFKPPAVQSLFEYDLVTLENYCNLPFCLTTISPSKDLKPATGSCTVTVERHTYMKSIPYQTPDRLQDSHAPNVDFPEKSLLQLTSYDLSKKILPSEYYKKMLQSTIKHVVMKKLLQSQPRIVQFHPSESQLVIVTKSDVSVWDWKDGTKLSSLSPSQNNFATNIASVKFLNPRREDLLLTGTDNGIVQVWENYSHRHLTEAVAEWTVVKNNNWRSRMTLFEWNQQGGTLFSASDSESVIRLWNLHEGRHCQDIPIGVDTDSVTCTCMTSFNNDTVVSQLVAGFSDGKVKLFDLRLSPDREDLTMRDRYRITKVVVLPHSETELYTTNQVWDSVKKWDLRYPSRLVGTISLPSSMGVSPIAFHERAGIVAYPSESSKTGHSTITTMKLDGGSSLNTIRYSSGLTETSFEPPDFLSFHPLEGHLAIGTPGHYVTVYSWKKP